jgi:hypothetical protein
MYSIRVLYGVGVCFTLECLVLTDEAWRCGYVHCGEELLHQQSGLVQGSC